MSIFNLPVAQRPPVHRPVADSDPRSPLGDLIDFTRHLVTNLAQCQVGFLVDLLLREREAGNRVAAIVGGVEAARVLSPLGEFPVSGFGLLTARQLVDGVCLRADDPGEILAYWLLSYGKPLPKYIKRGVGDAILRLYTPDAVPAFDDPRAWLRFADVIELSDIPQTFGDRTGLFRQLLDHRQVAV